MLPILSFFFFTDTATTEIYTLSLHDALPISLNSITLRNELPGTVRQVMLVPGQIVRSEEHTSELQSHSDLVCRLLLEKKKKTARPERGSPAAYRTSTDQPTQCERTP